MKKGTFQGGIHPYDGKELSMSNKTQEVMPGKELVYPMSQHIGAPAEPIVAVGDRVLVGQKIGQAQGFMSANVICSVSGTVIKIEPREVAGQEKVLSVVVENDEQYEYAPGVGKKRKYTSLSKQDIRECIKEAGIVGMGGAAFPTHIKLTPKDDNAIDTVIINGAECEPYLTSDYRMMLEEPEHIIQGLETILVLFDKAKGVIAIEDNKPEAIETLERLVQNKPNIEICPLHTKYPQGGERFLIYAVTGRKINSSNLPLDAGCIVCNVDTAIAVGMAVCESTPAMRKVVTISGDVVKNPGNYVVKTGTSCKKIIEAAGGFTKEPKKLLAGGPMMGKAMYTLDVPVVKKTSAILAFSEEMAKIPEQTSCIHCGRCVGVCPGHVVPQKLFGYAYRGDLAGFEKMNGMECCECGSCTYVCPASIRLTQAFSQARAAVLAERKKNQGGKK